MSEAEIKVGAKYKDGPDQLVFIDFETTGLESFSVPVEVGVAVINPHAPEADERHAATFRAFIDAMPRVWFPGVADQQALDMHTPSGLKSEWEAAGPNRMPRQEVGRTLIDFLDKALVPRKTGIPCGFSVTYDLVHLSKMSWAAYQYLHHRPIGVSALGWPIRLWLNPKFRPNYNPLQDVIPEHRALQDSFAAARALFWMRDNIYTKNPNWHCEQR